MIDLHSHTTSSDGELAPESLLALAAKRGVKQLAVTDHDTVAGLARAATAAKAHNIELVPGIEVSAFLGGREFHVLGHFLDPELPELVQLAGRLGEQRRERMAQMLEKLRAEGVVVSMRAVEAIAQGASLGRPHLARALVEAGHCTSSQEAFQRFLGDGRPGHVSSFRITSADAIALIHRAGGTASLAHPGVSGLEVPELRKLRQEGLDALEVHHPEHPPSQREKFLRWTVEMDLVPTAGSDFHGPKVSPGRQLGDESLSAEGLAALRARRPAKTL